MNDFNKTDASTYEKVLGLEIEIEKIIREYYKSHPNEKGNTKTDFYKYISSVLDATERLTQDLRYRLKNPDSIQGHYTR